MARMEFRDGMREVPEHIADLMRSLPTWELTYREASEKANWMLADSYATRAIDQMRSAHLRRMNDGRSR